MILYYMKHAWRMLWQDKFFTIISLLGIGLAVSFIMVILTVNDINEASVAPEVNRNRTLYVKSVSEDLGNDCLNCGFLSSKIVENVFYNLKRPKAVTALANSSMFVEAARFSGEGKTVSAVSSDADYWKFFEYDFVEGKPFSKSDFSSGLHVAVICKSLERELYKGEQALGKDLYISQQPYKIVGVVKDVSASCKFAYGRVWIPYTTDAQVMVFKDEVACGSLSVLMLAQNTSDFDKIIEEVKTNKARYNQPIEKDVKINLRGPDTHFEQRFRVDVNSENSSADKKLRLWIGIIVVLMVVPALNMANFTVSRMKKRQEELALRRSFGALRGDIVGQIIAENMVLTLIAGAMGFVLSIVVLFCFRSSFYSDGVTYSIFTFFRPTILGYLLLVCVVINLLAALLPAIKFARQPIVKVLKDSRS